MKKVTLDVESLVVESFATDAASLPHRGTVEARAAAPTIKTLCGDCSFGTLDTCCPCTP